MSAGGDRTDTAALRLTREESRAVLDHRLAELTDLDDKAMWTMRTAVILLGILASAAGIAGQTTVTSRSPATSASFGLGILGLFLTLIVGVGTYSVSITTPGVGGSHRREVRTASYTEQEWLETLLDAYDEWIAEMERSTDENARLVFWAQALLGLSLGLLFIATTLLAITG